MDDICYEETALYSLARALACQRTLLSEGVYSQIDEIFRDVGDYLKEKLNKYRNNFE
jgi:hypothetical protein